MIRAVFSKGAIYMVASALAFSVMSALVKEAGQQLPSQEIVLGRAIVSLILSYVLVRRIGLSIWGVRRPLLIVRGLLGFVGLSCYYYSVTHLPLAEATVIQYVHPLVTALLAGVFLAERLELKIVGAILVSLVGVALIARPSILFGTQTVALDGFAVAIGLVGAVFVAVGQARRIQIRTLAVAGRVGIGGRERTGLGTGPPCGAG